MADVLKSTNWWSTDPPAGVTVDLSAGATADETRLITAAEAHDASDTTYEGFTVQGDGVSVDGNGTLTQEQNITAVTGGIKFLRVKWRGRSVLGGSSPSGSGSLTPVINGILTTPQALTGSFANYSADFTSNPVTGLPWTAGTASAATFGYRLAADAANASFNASNAVRIAEFTVEVWGQDILATANPAVASGASTEMGTAYVASKDVRDPTAVVPLATTLDSGSALVTVRSFKSSLNDQTASTRDIFTSPASWPNSGTQLQPLYGAASQGLQGSSGGGNGINGTGVISGIKLCALVRVSKSTTATAPTNVRFGTGMGVKALVTPPTVRDIAALDDTMWESVETALIATGATAQPFEWGNGSNSVWSQMFGWTFNHTYSNDVTPKTTQVEVAEAWVEVHGPVGSQPVLIELTHALGIPLKLQELEGTF